jgi:hypothetical protein
LSAFFVDVDLLGELGALCVSAVKLFLRSSAQIRGRFSSLPIRQSHATVRAVTAIPLWLAYGGIIDKKPSRDGTASVVAGSLTIR